MARSNLGGLTELTQIDYGGCGEVHCGRDATGSLRAVKIFDDLSVNRALLSKMTQRLRVDGWPDGVMPVLSEQLNRSPLYQVMPFVGEQQADGSWLPHSLQNQIDRFPNDDAWKIIRSLAKSLSQMHARHVAHGNLKPGNVFTGAEGEVWVSDWCLGNMPDVHVFHFTDALLYQPPEQLLNPGGYHDEEGYGWDVFAFGVLAFRLLTGSFPRCHDTFAKVAPRQGENRHDGVKADPEKIVGHLKEGSVLEWPNEPRNELEARMRTWINQCLEIDPIKRPVSMMEVYTGFELIEKEVAEETEHQHLLDQRKRADRRSALLTVALLVVLLVALVLGGLWRLTAQKLSAERDGIEIERRALIAEVDQAQRAQFDAEASEASAIAILEEERATHLARMVASRQMSDRLFGWAMEKGRRRLPPIDGREFRLKQLESYYQSFLAETAEIPALQEAHARARLQLAEISISKGDAEEAGARMNEAMKSWASLDFDAAMRLRVATDWLIIAMLRESRSTDDAAIAFVAARNAFSKVPRQEVDQDRLDQLVAVLDYHEAKQLMAEGEETKALEQLMGATKTLNRLSRSRPDTAILRSELADCYLASAAILEGLGQLGDAREIRLLASKEMVKLLTKNTDDLVLQFDLAGCYAAMAEAAMMSGDIDSVVKRSSEALELLGSYLRKRPNDVDAKVMQAGQLSLKAGIHRDRGNSGAALDTYNQALGILEGLRLKHPNHVMASYRLALTWWQKGKMLGWTDKRSEEIELIRKASDLLASLEKAVEQSGPRPEQWMRSRAYVAGDLGHSLQLAKQNEEARKAFAEAVKHWQVLIEMRPRSEEYQSGLEWCQQRLQRIK